MPFQISCAVSANQNSSRSSGSMTPSSTKKIEIDRPPPIFLADQDDRNWLDFSGLHQGQNLEQFVERAIATRECDQRLGPEEKVQLAQCEIMKAETEFGRDVRIRKLLMRQT